MPSDVRAAKQTRIPMLERDQVVPEVAALYDGLLAQRGVVPNMFKTIAHIPAMAQGFAAFLKPIVGDGALPGWYKELVAVRVCHLHEFEYGIQAHSLSAKQKGASDQQIGAINEYERGPFSEAEKIGFRFADRLHRSAREIDDDFYAILQSVYTSVQILELTAVAAAFEFFPRFVDGLRIPVTPSLTHLAGL
ncbi:MAG: carboxymuconolactone decarboxylase family protein [Acidobacteria bacterium]|nr:carboxymuconolactone decarboxylase family protein [Acidobacteriota bacterium]